MRGLYFLYCLVHNSAPVLTASSIHYVNGVTVNVPVDPASKLIFGVSAASCVIVNADATPDVWIRYPFVVWRSKNNVDPFTAPDTSSVCAASLPDGTVASIFNFSLREVV